MPSVLTELQPFRVVVFSPVGDTLTNADSVPLESNGGCDLSEACTLRTPGLIPDLPPIRLYDEDGMVKGAIESVLLELTPPIGQVQDGGDEEPTPTPTSDTSPDDDDALLEFSDPPNDATDCATGAAVDDPAVEISGVNVTRVGEDIEVEVVTVQSPTISFEEAYSMAIILLWFGYEGLAEFHAGLQQQGQTDSKGNVIPGTEGSVTVTDDAVTFVVPDADSIPKGSILEVNAFHLDTEGGSVNCDTFMDMYTCFGRCDD